MNGPTYTSPFYGVVSTVDTAAVIDEAHLQVFAEILTGPTKASNTFEHSRSVYP